MNPVILAAGILPNSTFTIGGSSQEVQYNIGVNPVTVPQDTQHVLKLILQIISPSGFVMYQNTGWNTSSFTSPDSLTGSLPLPLLSGYTIPESGEYKINIQAQYVDSTSAPVTTNAMVNYASSKVCVSCLPNPALIFPVNCTNILLTITDVTNYVLQGYSLISVDRLITAVPPSGSNQISPTTTNKVLQIDNGSEGNGALWNGTYLLSLASTATYQLGTTTIVQNLNYTTPASGQGACIVACLDVRCQLYCALGQLMDEYIKLLTANPPLAPSVLTRFTAGSAMLGMINSAIECGDDYAKFIPNFWTVTGLDEKCSTCLTETATGPVTATGCGCSGGSGSGPAGPAGSVWRTGSGVPPDSLGVNTDLYLDNATGNVYQKSSNVYSLICNIKGPAGADGNTGAPGLDGRDGTSLLWNPYINYSNTGAGAGDIVTRTIPNDAFVNPSIGQNGGDQVKLLIEGFTTVPSTLGPLANAIKFTLGGNLFVVAFCGTRAFYILDIYITYINATHLQIDGTIKYLDPNSLQVMSDGIINTITIGYTAGSTIDFEADFSTFSVASQAKLVFTQAINYKKGIAGATFVPIYTNGNNTSTYQDNTLIGVNPNNLSVYVDGLICFPTTRYTFDKSTGTITWVGGSVLSTQTLAIIPS